MNLRNPEYGSRIPSTTKNISPILRAVFFTFLFLFGLQSVCSAQSGTLFLPLKVHAPSNAAELMVSSDKALQTALESQGIGFLPRNIVTNKISYDTAWPPTVDAVMPLAQASTNYVAAGSITQLGKTISIDITVLDMLGEEPPKYFFQQAESERRC